MGSIFKPTRQADDGSRVKYRKWRIVWTDECGARRSQMAYTDRKASEALLRKREQECERRAAGLIVAGENAMTRSLEDVEEEMLREMARAGLSEIHIASTRWTLSRLRNRTGWKKLGHVRPGPLADWLDELTNAGRSARTINHYRESACRLGRWCASKGYLTADPFATVKGATVGGRKWLPRRAYSPAEFLALITPRPIRPFRCSDQLHRQRQLVYTIAGLSGYRRGEIRQMEKRDCSPDGPRPTWHLRAAITKGRRLDVVPMLPECAEAILPLWTKLPLPTSILFPQMPADVTLLKDLALPASRASTTREDGSTSIPSATSSASSWPHGCPS